MPPEPVTAPPAGPTAPADNPRPRSRARFILLGFAVVVVVAAVAMWACYRYRESTDDAEIAAHIEPVAPRIPGVVTEVDVEDNQAVEPGQVLFKLDDSEYRQAVAQAEAQLATAQAAASGAQTGVPITEAASGGTLNEAQAALAQAGAGETLAEKQLAASQAQVSAARAQLAAAQATSDNAAATEKRFAALVAKQEVSQLQYDQIATQAKAAAAAAAAAQAEVQTAEQQQASAAANIEMAHAKQEQAAAAVRAAATAPQQLQVSRTQAEAAQSRVAQAQAALAEAQLNLSYTVVRASGKGKIGNRNVEVGQTLAPGQTVMEVVDPDVWVVANFKETQLTDMKPGQTADIRVDAYRETLKATVNSIGSATGSEFSLLPPENATGNYVKVVQRVPVKLYFNPNQDLSRLRPGLSVEVTVFTK